MSDAAGDVQSLGDLLAQLEEIPWFSNIGTPTPAGAGVERIYSWEDWPGPEEPPIRELSVRQQGLYDSIMKDAGGLQGALSSLWDRIHATVLHAAARKVPYDPGQDAWHGPSTAVWQAAWTAGLIGLCLRSGRPVPPELQEQWTWFVRGHWPSGYVNLDAGGRPGKLLVF
jgi:hypothetical protein